MANNKNILLIILFILSIIAPTFATNTNEPHTYYVTTNGNDQNNGLDWEHSKQHIDTALRLAEDGDTIMVGPGTYEEIGTDNDNLGFDKNIKLIGINKPTITNGRKYLPELNFVVWENCLIQGFILKDCHISNHGKLTVKDCEFQKSDPIVYSSESIANWCECRLINCSFQDLLNGLHIFGISHGDFSCIYMTHCTFESKYKKHFPYQCVPLITLSDNAPAYVVWDKFTRDQIFANSYGINEIHKDRCYLENKVPQKIKDKSPFLFEEKK